jgi:anti-sigma B factor antagonist
MTMGREGAMRCSAERTVGDVTVLDLAAQDALGLVRTEVSDRVRQLAAQGRRKLVLNLADVSYLDSSGLGDLAQAHQAATADKATLKLSNVQPRVADLLRTVNLWRVFESFDSEGDAVSSFR